MDGRAPSGRGRPIGEPVGGGNEKHYRKIASGAPRKKSPSGLFFLVMRKEAIRTRESARDRGVRPVDGRAPSGRGRPIGEPVGQSKNIATYGPQEALYCGPNICDERSWPARIDLFAGHIKV